MASLLVHQVVSPLADHAIMCWLLLVSYMFRNMAFSSYVLTPARPLCRPCFRKPVIVCRFRVLVLHCFGSTARKLAHCHPCKRAPCWETWPDFSDAAAHNRRTMPQTSCLESDVACKMLVCVTTSGHVATMLNIEPNFVFASGSVITFRIAKASVFARIRDPMYWVVFT